MKPEGPSPAGIAPNLFPRYFNPAALFPGLSRWWLALWLGGMIAVPIGIWTHGLASTAMTMLWATATQGLLVFYLLAFSHGWPTAIRTALLLAALGWAVEFAGSRTGFPFGPYDYTQLLQPQIGRVPLLVPLAWFMMLPVCWGTAELITGKTGGARFVATAAGAMTGWDLFLDPQMVAWGFWRWEAVPAWHYFGIPWQNYLGWFLTAALLTVLVRPRGAVPAQINGAFLAIYMITWLLEFGGLAFFWGLPGPAAGGALGMGLFVWLARRAATRREPPQKS